MAKRASENQITKDSYEDDNDDPRLVETKDPGLGMTRASDDVMKRRKVVRVSRSKFGGVSTGTAPAAPTSSASQFASANFAGPSPRREEKEQSKNQNPFANISIASNSTPTFSFGSGSLTLNAPNLATSPRFSFSAAPPDKLASVRPFSTETSMVPQGNNGQSKSRTSNVEERCMRLDEKFYKFVTDHWESGRFCDEYSTFLKEYKRYAEGLYDEYNKTTIPATQNITATSSTLVSAELIKPSTEGKSTINAEAFKDISARPGPKPFASFASPADAPPAGTFSFTSKPTTTTISNSTVSANPSFSFGTIPPPSSSTAPSNEISANDNDDDPTSNPDDGLIEVIEHEDNTEEEILFEVKVAPLKKVDKTWKKFGSGLLRLYRHKVNSKQRMVMRNSIGKVQLNLSISKGMTFEKQVKDSAKGTVAYVRFCAVENTIAGPEIFMLKCTPATLDELHSKLEEMAK